MAEHVIALRGRGFRCSKAGWNTGMERWRRTAAMPSQGRRPPIFLSYSRGDIEHARPVIALLEGRRFRRVVGRAARRRRELSGDHRNRAQNRLLAWWCCGRGPRVASHWVRDEAQRGRERGCLVPLSLDGTMAPLGFRQFQLLDIAGWSVIRAMRRPNEFWPRSGPKRGRPRPQPDRPRRLLPRHWLRHWHHLRVPRFRAGR